MDINPKAQNKQVTIHKPQEANEDGRPKWGMLCFLREREQNAHRSNFGDKVWSRDWRKGHAETALPVDSSYKQSPNPKLPWMTRSVYRKEPVILSFWRGPARALQIHRQMLAANHCTEQAFPMEELEGGLEELGEGCSPMGRMMISANQIPQGSQGLSHQPKGTHGSVKK